jgi:hypothetical protein
MSGKVTKLYCFSKAGRYRQEVWIKAASLKDAQARLENGEISEDRHGDIFGDIVHEPGPWRRAASFDEDI